ncbi:MAG: hypothetical protein LBT26_07720 [Clostridiales Family XIII bacterium]|jgi:hypothetical protein|nr:hypothetical protein [Clostridiales Family XIII bacterium]
MVSVVLSFASAASDSWTSRSLSLSGAEVASSNQKNRKPGFLTNVFLCFSLFFNEQEFLPKAQNMCCNQYPYNV